MPNVTAIDWNKQTRTAQSFSEQKGGMSFTVQEARAAFYFALLPYPHHVAVPDYSKKQRWCPSVGDARDLNVFRC